MQEVFRCPTCGAQNLVGQEYCQHCGQRFQYNCPYCGTVVDATLVNCPRCREGLYWPTPRRVKPFPKEETARPLSRRHGGVGGEVPETQAKERQKSDPWLTGCLGIVIIAIIIMVAFFLYDWLSRPSTPEELPPSSKISEALVLHLRTGHFPDACL